MYLTCHSYHSLQYGVLSISELVSQAARKGITRLGLTDINTSAGILEFMAECKKNGISPVVGIDFRHKDNPLYIGIARSHRGLHELNNFLSAQNRSGVPFPEQAPLLPDTIFLYNYTPHINPESLPEGHYIGLNPQNAFSARRHFGAAGKFLLNLPLTLGSPDDFLLHAYLVAIGRNVMLSRLKKEWACSREAHWLKAEQELVLRQQYPQLCNTADRLAEECSFEMELSEGLNKKVFGADESDDIRHLTALARAGLVERYGTDNTTASERLERELKVIFDQKFTAYYLITHNLTQYGMGKGYYHVGRGSGANSIVAYCLRITDVDPIELNLYFERFLNPKRSSPPDFDIDFSWTDREDVQRYLIDKYGAAHTALLGTTVTFRERSILRELGKVRGLPKEEIDNLVHNPHSYMVQDSTTIAKILNIGTRIKNFPRGHSIHAGGILISEKPLTWYTALIYPPKALPVTELDMYDAEKIRLHKFDILSQRGLGHINDTIALVKEHRGTDIDIHAVERMKADSLIAEKLYNGDTMGCFYVESPAMRQLLQKLRCREYITLVAASSIIRPGVASSGMMSAYIERYHNPQGFSYLHPVLKEQLEETYGVMVYQEDVLKVCHHYAGMDLADADLLRRAMSGKNRLTDNFERIRLDFFRGAEALGRPPEITDELWRQISSFGGFSFCKAHSASYAVESYQSMHLKTYYPLEFYIAAINNYGGFYRTWVYVNEAVKAGGILHTPCINNSNITTCLRNLDGHCRDIFPGFELIKGLDTKWQKLLTSERTANGMYAGPEDLVARLSIPFEQLRILIKAGALDFTGHSRKMLLMKAYLLSAQAGREPAGIAALTLPVKLPVLQQERDTPLERAFNEIELLGFPVSLGWFGLLATVQLPVVRKSNLHIYTGRSIETTGKLVTTKPVSTKNSERMLFGTFLDYEGGFIDTVHFPKALNEWPVYGGGIYRLRGLVTNDFGVYTINISECELLPMKALPGGLGQASLKSYK